MIIESLGTAIPPHTLNLEDRFKVAELYVNGDDRDRWFVPMIFEKSTVRKRHCVFIHSEDGDIDQRQDFFQPTEPESNPEGPTTGERMIAYEEHAPQLALSACQDAFQRSRFDPSSITHLVTASCTGFTAPGMDVKLIEKLGMPASVERTHLGFMGCHAGQNCLRVAAAFARADPQAKVLVCATELCGLHYQYVAKNDQKVANALFGDGSGAALLVGNEQDRKPNPAAWKVAGTGSFLIPETQQMMSWKIRDHGFTMGLSDRIPETIKNHVPPWFDGWLRGYGLTRSEIRSWAVHPGGPQILNAFEQAMNLSSTSLQIPREVLQTHGNMSSATIFFVLKKLNQIPDQLPCVAVGFGPGLTLEATLFLPA